MRFVRGRRTLRRRGGRAGDGRLRGKRRRRYRADARKGVPAPSPGGRSPHARRWRAGSAHPALACHPPRSRGGIVRRRGKPQARSGGISLSLRAFGQVKAPLYPSPTSGRVAAAGDGWGSSTVLPRLRALRPPHGRPARRARRLARADGAELRLTPWRAILLAPARRPLAADISSPRPRRRPGRSAPRRRGLPWQRRLRVGRGRRPERRRRLRAGAGAASRRHGVRPCLGLPRRAARVALPASFTLVARRAATASPRRRCAERPARRPLMTADEMTTYLRGARRSTASRTESLENA